ncbi:hypothetical protein O9929_04515 [Vibrio lentus]|nr:hypothetical protein [Vibrio lentus]
MFESTLTGRFMLGADENWSIDMNHYTTALNGLNCMGCAKKVRTLFGELDNTTINDISPTYIDISTPPITFNSTNSWRRLVIAWAINCTCYPV